MAAARVIVSESWYWSVPKPMATRARCKSGATDNGVKSNEQLSRHSPFQLPRQKGSKGGNPLALTCVTMMASGVMNLTPWGGPSARAASALHVDPADLFVPMIP